MIDLQHAPATLRDEYARRAFLWGDGETRALQGLLQDFGERVYLRTIVAELYRQGIELTPERVSQVREAWQTRAAARARDIATAHAQSIAATHNRTVSGMVDRILARSPTYNRSQLVGALRRLEDDFSAWKAHQIDETERYVFYQAAFEDFYQVNSDLAALFEFGGSLQCDVCREVAAANPYTYGAMQQVDDPPHVGCLDVWEPLG